MWNKEERSVFVPLTRQPHNLFVKLCPICWRRNKRTTKMDSEGNIKVRRKALKKRDAFCPLNLPCSILFSHRDSAAHRSLCSARPLPSTAGVRQEITTQKINDLSQSLLLMSPGHNKSRWPSLKKHKPVWKKKQKPETPKPQRWRGGERREGTAGSPYKSHPDETSADVFQFQTHSRGREQTYVDVNGRGYLFGRRDRRRQAWGTQPLLTLGIPRAVSGPGLRVPS